METLLSLICVFFILSLSAGLMIPSKVIRWGEEEKKTKRNVLLIYGTGSIISYYLLVLFFK